MAEQQPQDDSASGDPSGGDPPHQDDLQRAIEHIMYTMTPPDEAREKSEKQRLKIIGKIIKEFDTRKFEGPDDWIYRKSFKDNLREDLIEFLNQHHSSHVFKNEVLAPVGYELSGQQIGGSRIINPKGNCDRILLEALTWKIRRALGLLWTLAEQNHDGALLRLAQAVVPYAKAINEKASVEPGALDDWPKTLPFWPAIKSSHRDFDTDHRALLRILQVGTAFPFTIGEEVRWTARDAIGRWAIHLAQSIEIMIVSDYTEDELSEMWECKIDRLRDFSRNTWENWWNAAKALLVHDYIDVFDIPELNKTVKSLADRKSPGRIRKRIYQALKDKFKSMASENKVR
jgi:hypothetical protein